jgi:hypothetical protein
LPARTETGRRRPTARLPFALSLLVLFAAAAFAEAGCGKKELPSPWREMHFPLSSAELLPGADANGFTVTYKASGQQEDLLREFRRALERGGYVYERDCASNDPSSREYCSFFKKGADRKVLSMSGRRTIQVKVGSEE